jgi:ligand-binding sensor domain-containing protein
VIKNVFRPGMENIGKINDMAEDQEGNAWIVSNSGIYRTSGTKFLFLDPGVNSNYKDIHALRNDLFTPNAIWFSNDEGLFFQNLEDNTTKQYLQDAGLPDLKVMCLYQDHLGYIWAGTFNYGVFRISPTDGSYIRVTESSGLVNNNVLSISGHNDTIWMATLGGASELVLEGESASGPFSIHSHNHDNGLVNDFIYSVYEDEQDQLWFATDGDGISVKTKKGWITYNEKDGLTDDVVYSITGDKYGNIWIASASKGIFKFSDGKFLQYSVKEGLSSKDITGIATIDNELLIIQDNGLDILDIPSGRIAHYREEIGLSEISPDLNVISKDKSGNLWIGSRTGIIRYQHGSGMSRTGPGLFSRTCRSILSQGL